MVSTKSLRTNEAIYAAEPDIAVLYSTFANRYCTRCFAAVEMAGRQSSRDGDSRLATSFACPQCDQFVLCRKCVKEMRDEVRQNRHSIEARCRFLPPMLMLDASDALYRHRLLLRHRISCLWYNKLPASVRAPGLDTDFLRFCLDYGAAALLGDAQLVDGIATLATNAAVQSKEAHHFCEVFARDRIVATFGPPSVAAAASSPSAPVRRSTAGGESLHQGVVPPLYPVDWQTLRDVLLRTRCNSFGFPFTADETLGWALHSRVCMLNHSCCPNAAVVMVPADATTAPPPTRVGCSDNIGNDGDDFDDFAAVVDRESPSLLLLSSSSSSASAQLPVKSLAGFIGVKAIKPIAAGEEITISYVDLGNYQNDVNARRRHLLEQYRFLCRCPLCEAQSKKQKRSTS